MRFLYTHFRFSPATGLRRVRRRERGRRVGGVPRDPAGDAKVRANVQEARGGGGGDPGQRARVRMEKNDHSCGRA